VSHSQSSLAGLTKALEIFYEGLDKILLSNIIFFNIVCQAKIKMVNIKQKYLLKIISECLIFRPKILQNLES
jgi:hypothetical protein